MTSRILQENSSLILTQASEPIINENYIGANSFVVVAPVVQSTTITQVHVTNVVDITTGQPIVDEKTLSAVTHIREAKLIADFLLIQKRIAQVDS